MKDQWYADKRDLVKWSVLYHLAHDNNINIVLQIAFYRPSEYDSVFLGEQEKPIPQEVLLHFRNWKSVKQIKSNFQIDVFSKVFDNREDYLKDVLSKLQEYSDKKLLVFLDPDIGLEPQNSGSKEHVDEKEAKRIWEVMKKDHILVLYQHKDNRSGKPWKDRKKKQLEEAIGVQIGSVNIAEAPKIAHDVVFFYIRKVL
jgi:hypothetical protein